MINFLHSIIHRPEKGWDPVPSEYVMQYGDHEWKIVDESIIDELENLIDGFAGKRVLDLGGGPGQYSVAFALRGAEVTWYDISSNYCQFAMQKAKNSGVNIQFSLGYMDEAAFRLKEQFDLVFNRICWNYGFGDKSFSDVVFSLVKNGGIGYIDTTHSNYQYEKLSLSTLSRTWLNDRLGVKIGHPYPPKGRIGNLFLNKKINKIIIDYRCAVSDRVIFIKS